MLHRNKGYGSLILSAYLIGEIWYEKGNWRITMPKVSEKIKKTNINVKVHLDSVMSLDMKRYSIKYSF